MESACIELEWISDQSWIGFLREHKREDLKFKQSQTVKVVILQTLEKSHFHEKWGGGTQPKRGERV